MGDKGTGLGHSLWVTKVVINRLPVLSLSPIHELFFPGACVPAGVGLGVRASVPSLHLYFLFLPHCLSYMLILHRSVDTNNRQVCTNKYPHSLAAPKRYFLFFFLSNLGSAHSTPKTLVISSLSQRHHTTLC